MMGFFDMVTDTTLDFVGEEGKVLQQFSTSLHARSEKFCKDNFIQIAMMPASTTYLYQMIDVVVGKPFKDAMCEEWAAWMMKNNLLTPAGNWKKPSRMDCLEWVVRAWEEISSSGNVRKAKELGMTADPGPPIDGYIERKFNDEMPDEQEADVHIAELETDFEKDDQ